MEGLERANQRRHKAGQWTGVGEQGAAAPEAGAPARMEMFWNWKMALVVTGVRCVLFDANSKEKSLESEEIRPWVPLCPLGCAAWLCGWRCS